MYSAYNGIAIHGTAGNVPPVVVDEPVKLLLGLGIVALIVALLWVMGRGPAPVQTDPGVRYQPAE
jgi:hypothetical protein